MRTLHEFMEFTGLKGKQRNFAILLVITSFLYCSAYEMCASLIYGSGSILLYYIGMYLFVMISSYVFMIVLFQYIKAKRNDGTHPNVKLCILPLVSVQSLYFIILALLGFFAYDFLFLQQSFLYYIVSALLILSLMLYIPMQIFSSIAIYDGMKNPFIIWKVSFSKIITHYQSVFYSLICVGFICAISYLLMNVLFHYSMNVSIITMAMDIMVRNNPFLMMFELVSGVLDNPSFVLPVIVSFLLGILQCVLYSFYYMLMICIFDHDVKV